MFNFEASFLVMPNKLQRLHLRLRLVADPAPESSFPERHGMPVSVQALGRHRRLGGGLEFKICTVDVVINKLKRG